ncbi:MAG: NAD(+)/NADH kinase [Planctomycetota bacterium]
MSPNRFATATVSTGDAPIERTKVVVFVHTGKAAASALLGELVPWLEERFRAVQVELDVWRYCQERERRIAEGEGDLEVPGLVVVLGGDGAMLMAVRAFAATPVPTLGINFGRVGFLASTPQTRWRDVLEGVLEGRGVIEPRMRLAVEVLSSGERGIALNEAVVSREPEDAMVSMSLHVGELLVTNYRADGLIVSTPSGSTAYSLSAGGPILAPNMLGTVVTPICSQSLANRPIVLHPEASLSVRVAEAERPADVILDGRKFARLAVGETLSIARHPDTFPLLTMPDLDPYRRLRERLGWRGGLGDGDASS